MLCSVNMVTGLYPAARNSNRKCRIVGGPHLPEVGKCGFKSSFLMEHLVRDVGPELFQEIEGRVEPHLYSPVVHCVAYTALQDRIIRIGDSCGSQVSCSFRGVKPLCAFDASSHQDSAGGVARAALKTSVPLVK